MCGICGCGGEATMTDADGHAMPHTHADGTTHTHGHIHDHDHGDGHHHHDHEHLHRHAPEPGLIALETAVLARNDGIAARNRGWFEGRGVVALNLVSSPGAGKTALLERTIRDLRTELDIAVIEGDQMTANDARRIRAAGARAVQINTGAGCHLEAEMIRGALPSLGLRHGSLLLIENVGNLVCPAMFDLGERMKVAIISVTEGEDKPLKYPFMFRAASVVIVNKVDLAPHLDFDREALMANLREVNPDARVLTLSARSGEGMAAWYDLLRGEFV